MIYSIIVLAILLAISLSSSVATAIIDNATMQYYVDIHNSRINNAPQILKSLVGDERIDLNITRNDGSIYRTGLGMKNARVSKIIEGGIADPTVSINATEDAINRIIRSDDPIAIFLLERNSGSISVQMHHPHNEGEGGRFLGLPSFFNQSLVFLVLSLSRNCHPQAISVNLFVPLYLYGDLIQNDKF